MAHPVKALFQSEDGPPWPGVKSGPCLWPAAVQNAVLLAVGVRGFQLAETAVSRCVPACGGARDVSSSDSRLCQPECGCGEKRLPIPVGFDGELLLVHARLSRMRSRGASGRW